MSTEKFLPIEEFFSTNIEDKKEHYVYIYLNPLKPGKYTYNDFISFQYEPFYVGKGKEDRMFAHLTEKGNSHKLNTIQKIRKNNSEPIITKLEFNLTNKNSLDLEIFYIKTIGRKDLGLGPLTNMTDGGEGGINPSKAARKKMGDNSRGEKNFWYGKDRSGKNNPSYGKTWDCQKIISDESRENYRKSKQGDKNPRYGIICETFPSARPVLVENIKFNSLREASKITKISGYRITKRIKNNITGYSYLSHNS